MKLSSFVARLSTYRFLIVFMLVSIIVSAIAAGCSSNNTTVKTTSGTTTTSAVTTTSSAMTAITTTTVSAVVTTSSAGTTTPTTSTTTTAVTTSPSTVTTTTTMSATTTTTAAVYSIAVSKNGQTIATLTLADLQKLTQVTSGGETGPTLLSVLNSVGVTDFTQLTINGFTQGRTATAATTLQKAQVTNNVMLALVTRGTAKLTGSDVTTQIIDVNQIIVQ
jgi:outer membrane receptor protein involved in Fe transport